MHPIVLMQLASDALSAAPPQDGAQTLHQHQDADDAEKKDKGQADHQVDLADGAQPGEQFHAQIRTEEAAGE